MSNVCRIRGCEKPVKSRSLCGSHYQRFIRHGHPQATAKTPIRKRWSPDEGLGILHCVLCGQPYAKHTITKPCRNNT